MSIMKTHAYFISIILHLIMSWINKQELWNTKEQETSRSDLSKLEKQINPLYNLRSTEEKIKEMQLSNVIRNNTITEKQQERNALYKKIQQNNESMNQQNTIKTEHQKQKTNEQDYIKIIALDKEIQSLLIDTKIDMIAFSALEDEKNEIISNIEWVVQTKTEVMNTTPQESSWLTMILWTSQNQGWNNWEQAIRAKNIEKITHESTTVSDEIIAALEPEDKKAIESAILNHCKQDPWYQNKIHEIISTWSQSWKSIQEIKIDIEHYNKTMMKQLMPIFITEIEHWNIIVTRENGTRVVLSQLSSEKLWKNKSYQTFKKLYQKFIENPLLDLTDLNYLTREWITENTVSWLESQLINAVSINRDIENFLFNDPQANPEQIQNWAHHFFEQPHTLKEQQKIVKIMWKTISKHDHKREMHQKNKNRKQSETKKTMLPSTRKNEFLDKINTFSTKRINQSLLLSHCATLRETFGSITSQWTKLVDAIDFDFTTLSIIESWKQMKQNITYQNLSSTISIDGETWTVTTPSILSALRGLQSHHELTKLPVSFTQRKKILTKAASLTEKELLKCKTWADVQTRITENIRHASETLDYAVWNKTTEIAENLEKESLIMNFTHFMSGSLTTKNHDSINKNALSQNENNQKWIHNMLQKRTQWKEWKEPMNLQELKTLNAIFMDTKLQKLVSNKEWIPSHNRDVLLTKCWFYKRWPHAPFSEIMTFFSSLQDMAHSQVDPQQESGYRTLQKLLENKWYGWSVPFTKNHTVLII